MTRRQYLDVGRTRWPSLLAGLLLGLLAGVAVTVLTPATYTAAATVFVSARSPNGDLADAVEGGDLSAQRMATYLEVLSSDKLAAEVAAQLGEGISAGDVSEKITATTAPETLFLTATVVDQSPERAAAIANLAADRFIDTIAELEQPDPATAPLVTARTFQPAVPPTAPTGPRPVLNIALGLVLGAIAGFALALLRNAFDRSIRSRDQLRRVLDAPVLGTIGADKDLSAHPLAVRERPRAPVAEAFRHLRATLQFGDGRGEHRVILVTSAVPGEGRTTTVCNLALAMADAGSRVLVIDADLRRPRVADLFDVEHSTGLTNALAARVDWVPAVRRWKDSLDVLPSGPLPPNPGELLSLPATARLLADARARYDVVLVDSPPVGPVSDAVVLAPLVDGVLLVVRWGSTTTRAVEDAAEALRLVSARMLGSVLTRTRSGRLRRVTGYDARGAGEPADEQRSAPRPGSWAPEPGGANGSTPSPATRPAPAAAVRTAHPHWPPSPRPRPRPSPAASVEDQR